MTDQQNQYRKALLAAAGEGATWSWTREGLEGGAIKFTILRGERSVARAIVEPTGRLWGAWDPQHLTDGIKVR